LGFGFGFGLGSGFGFFFCICIWFLAMVWRSFWFFASACICLIPSVHLATEAERVAVERQQLVEMQRGLQAQKDNCDSERSNLEKQVRVSIFFLLYIFFPIKFSKNCCGIVCFCVMYLSFLGFCILVISFH
jgi:hypothetical protein